MMTYDEAAKQIHLVDHPVVQSRLVKLRDKTTPSAIFRQCLREISISLALAALRDAETRPVRVNTPLRETDGVTLSRSITIIPVLRAGLGFAEGMLQVLPDALMGHIGMVRNEQTHLPEQYYFKVPSDLPESEIILADPMLATGNSAAAAVSLLKDHGARRIRFAGLVGCPQGVENLRSAHPDVPIFLAALDPELNENCYIVPGLGDAGDRYFGTA